MKNTIKIIIIATIITIAIMISTAFALPASAEVGDRGEFYPRLAVVIGIEQIAPDLWIVSCMDRFGNVWEFFADADEWNRGDLCNLLMWNMGEREEEDEIVEVYWEGYLEENEIPLFFETV